MRIGVNCGHTANGPGSGAFGYLNESKETRQIGYKLMKLLKDSGHTVFDCTNDVASSVSSNLNNIVALANAQNLDLFVSIHLNAGGGKGSEVYTYDGNPETFPESKKICDNLESLGFVNRGVKKGSNLYVIKNTKAKAILVEVCFVDSHTDEELYKKIGVDRIARAICDGIINQNTVSIVELETVNDIVYELGEQGIITDKELWLEKLENDEDSYWLARKCVNYIRRLKQ